MVISVHDLHLPTVCRVELGEYSGSRTRRGSHRSRNGVIEAVLEAFRQTRVVCEPKKNGRRRRDAAWHECRSRG